MNNCEQCMYFLHPYSLQALYVTNWEDTFGQKMATGCTAYV